VKLLKKLFSEVFLVVDIEAEILRYVGPPTVVIFRYLMETHPEAFFAETSLYLCISVQYQLPGELHSMRRLEDLLPPGFV